MDGRGVPLSIVVTGANRHDVISLIPVIEANATPRPDPDAVEQNMCLDKGYDCPFVYDYVEGQGYIAHIKGRGQEKIELETIPGARARRWVVEASHSWFNRFRKILVRFERKEENHMALLHLVCGIIAFRKAQPCTKRDGMILA